MSNKKFTVRSTRRNHGREDSKTDFEGTIPELIKTFSYTLECGKSWESEKGNYKINRNPKGIKSLVSNLNKATTNSAANGDSRTTYSEVLEK